MLLQWHGLVEHEKENNMKTEDLKRGDTIHNTLINRTGYFVEHCGFEIAVKTINGLEGWDVRNCETVESDKSPLLEIVK